MTEVGPGKMAAPLELSCWGGGWGLPSVHSESLVVLVRPPRGPGRGRTGLARCGLRWGRMGGLPASLRSGRPGRAFSMHTRPPGIHRPTSPPEREACASPTADGGGARARGLPQSRPADCSV